GAARVICPAIRPVERERGGYRSQCSCSGSVKERTTPVVLPNTPAILSHCVVGASRRLDTKVVATVDYAESSNRAKRTVLRKLLQSNGALRGIAYRLFRS